MLRFAIAVCVSIMALGPAAARDLKVASWNLGWHMSKAEAAQWIRDCGNKLVGAIFERANKAGLGAQVGP